MTAAADPVDAVPAAELLAAQPPLLERKGALAEIRDRIGSRGRLLVIDDDPTGTQSIPACPSSPRGRGRTSRAMADAGTVFALTNSRSLPERKAIAVNTEITERAAAIAADEGFGLAVASRSDSTMRGHFPQEPDAVADALEAAGHRRRPAAVPLLPRGRPLHPSTTSSGSRRTTSSSPAPAPPTPPTVPSATPPPTCGAGSRRRRAGPCPPTTC